MKGLISIIVFGKELLAKGRKPLHPAKSESTKDEKHAQDSALTEEQETRVGGFPNLL
jgi:hypothetical protein